MIAGLAFDHLHLRSPDPDGAARFYVDHLGGTVADRIEAPDSLRVVVDLGGARLLIDRVPPGAPAGTAPPHRGLEHLGFKVDDLEATAAALRQAGIVFTMEPKLLRPGLKISFIRGPDDVSIELLERA